MDLRELINQISKKHENVLIGEGEKFTKEQIRRIENFIQRHSFLKNDLSYCKYLVEISALSFHDLERDEDFTLLGFDWAKTVLFEGGEYSEELVDKNGFFLFGYYNFIKEEKISEFYFDSKSDSQKGIYIKKKHDYQNTEKSYELVSKNFIEFLGLIESGKLEKIINE